MKAKSPRVEMASASVATAVGAIWILCTEKGIRELNIGELHIVDANGDPAE